MSASNTGLLRPKISLGALRLAFLSLGVGLLVALFALHSFMQERLLEMRIEREQMVASRVFDELEREISSFLDGESERAHYTSLQETDPNLWAPFVVGYFKRGELLSDIVTKGGSRSEGHRRVEWALEQTPLTAMPSSPALPEELVLEEQESERGAVSSPRTHTLHAPQKLETPSIQPKVKRALKKGSSSGSAIMEQLNRAQQRRKVPAKKPSSRTPPSKSDQFQDYTEAF